VPGYEASSWDGIGAPANTPPEIIAILNKEVNAALADPVFKARLTPAASGTFEPRRCAPCSAARQRPPPVEEKFDGELPLMSTSVVALVS
jgi:hypothetical protein